MTPQSHTNSIDIRWGLWRISLKPQSGHAPLATGEWVARLAPAAFLPRNRADAERATGALRRVWPDGAASNFVKAVNDAQASLATRD